MVAAGHRWGAALKEVAAKAATSESSSQHSGMAKPVSPLGSQQHSPLGSQQHISSSSSGKKSSQELKGMSGETVEIDPDAQSEDNLSLPAAWREVIADTVSVRSDTPVPTERGASSVSEVIVAHDQSSLRLAEQLRRMQEQHHQMTRRQAELEASFKSKQQELERQHQRELVRIREEVRLELDEHLQKATHEASKTLSNRRHSDSQGGGWAEKKRRRAAEHQARKAAASAGGAADSAAGGGGTSSGSRAHDGMCSRCNRGEAGRRCCRDMCRPCCLYVWQRAQSDRDRVQRCEQHQPDDDQ